MGWWRSQVLQSAVHGPYEKWTVESSSHHLQTWKLLYILCASSLSHTRCYWLRSHTRLSWIPQPLWSTQGLLYLNSFSGWKTQRSRGFSLYDWPCGHYALHSDNGPQMPEKYLCWWSHEWGGCEGIYGWFHCTGQISNYCGKSYVVGPKENTNLFSDRQMSSWQ
jgi:hypothetical protein